MYKCGRQQENTDVFRLHLPLSVKSLTYLKDILTEESRVQNHNLFFSFCDGKMESMGTYLGFEVYFGLRLWTFGFCDLTAH